MKIIESLKRLFRKRRLETSYIEQVETGKLSIIDTSDLNIDRNLTREEDESRKIFLEEVNSGNFSAFISYGNDIAKETNHYMDIIRKRLNQNIEENESFARNVSLEQVIRHKLKIAFNHAEINCIMDSLNELKRNCELRIIALEDLGSIESKKAKRKMPFMSSRIDTNKISSINNTISRLSVNIKIINMLSQSVRNEQKTYFNENNALDAFIRENDESESTRIANKVLNEVFRELKMSINAISTFSNTNPLIIEGKTIDKIDIDKNSLDKKVEIIALAKQYLDLYVAQNKEKVLAPGGLLERAEEYRSELWKEIESDYLDIPLWAKKGLSSVLIQEQESELKKKVNKFHSKYYERIANIEKLIAIFGEEIPDDFKEKFYKTKFYYYALLDETEISDSCHTKPIEINSEEERNYYLKFVSEIVNKIHIKSDDSELIKFMNKHLSLKNPNSILDDFSKFVTLLRIEKSGRAGLYTLNLFTTDFEDEPNCCCCLDQINTMNSKKYFSQMSKIPRHNISPIAKDILKLWKREEISEKTYNDFWGDYDDGWNLVEKINEELYPRSNPSNNSMKYRSNIDYWTFLGNTIQDFNRDAREKNVEPEKKFNHFFEAEINNAQYAAMFAYLIEEFTNKWLTKEEILEYIYEKMLDEDKSDIKPHIIVEKILSYYLARSLEYKDFKYFKQDIKHLEFLLKRELMNKNPEDTKTDISDKFDLKFVCDTCKELYRNPNSEIFIAGPLIDICLSLHKYFGKENVRDEMLKNYSIGEHIITNIYGEYEENTYIMHNLANNITKSFDLRYLNALWFDDVINFLIFNKLSDKEILHNDNNRKLTHLMSYYLTKYIYRDLEFNSIKDRNFLEMIISAYRSVDYSKGGYAHYMDKDYFINKDEYNYCCDIVYGNDPDRTIPDSLYEKFEICSRMHKIIESTDNMNEILCPDLVRIINAEDFEQMFENSLDENNRLHLEVFFESYRTNEDMEK